MTSTVYEPKSEMIIPYLSEIFPREIPERIKDKLVLMQIGAD